MKAQIHPNWNPTAQVICACGNKFTTGSTQEVIHVDVCSNCHPFFTGQMRYVDAAGRVDKFKARQSAVVQRTEGMSKKERRSAKRALRIEEELSRPSSLEDLRNTK